MSREAFAVWTPIGLMQPTVLPFGQNNSGTEAQGPCRAAAASLKNLANYVDDWLGYSDDLEQLFLDFAKFLRVCADNDTTLNVHKTRFGFPKAQFFGFEVDKAGTTTPRTTTGRAIFILKPPFVLTFLSALFLLELGRRSTFLKN